MLSGFVLSIAALFFVVAFMIIRALKHDWNVSPAGKKNLGVRIVIGILVAILVIVGGMLIYGSIEQSVDVKSDKIEIGSLYGTTLNMHGITSVALIGDLPGIQAKAFGFDFANVLKGDFRLEGLGDGKLYVNTRTPPFIEIEHNERHLCHLEL